MHREEACDTYIKYKHNSPTTTTTTTTYVTNNPRNTNTEDIAIIYTYWCEYLTYVTNSSTQWKHLGTQEVATIHGGKSTKSFLFLFLDWCKVVGLIGHQNSSLLLPHFMYCTNVHMEYSLDTHAHLLARKFFSGNKSNALFELNFIVLGSFPRVIM